jgi:diadenosine tetraphosphate (Ap4A) HIT family hydrolase
VLCEGADWRIVRVDDVDFPVFYRVIWLPHILEFSELSADDQRLCMGLVVEVERAVRRVLAPTKMNLASLGNVVPHLHWHVVARFEQDSHFPNSIWGERMRSVSPSLLVHWRSALPMLDQSVIHACQVFNGGHPLSGS